MAAYISSFCHRMRRFAGCEQGSSTIEALVWVPLIVYLMSMVADFSFVFYGKANVLRLLQDSNRALSVGQVATTAEVEDLVRNGLSAISEDFTVTTTVDRGIIRTVLSVPASAFTSVHAVPGMSHLNVNITSQQFLEQ